MQLTRMNHNLQTSMFKPSKAIGFLFIVGILTLGCSNDNQRTVDDTSSFELKKDIYDFSSRLEENDTLILLVDASVCTSMQIDYLVFIKKNNNITVNTTVHIWEGEQEIYNLGSVDYIKSQDSLNYEDLFKFVNNKGVKDQKSNSNVFTVIHKQDTLRLFSDHLMDHLTNLGYFTDIQQRLYPDAELYQPILALEPEKEADINNLHSSP